jgi:putative NADPH-quinone reductase
MSKVLIVVAHARRNSLTHQIALRFAEGLVALGHETETADLAAEGFDPVLREVDEPDWQNRNKVYSPEVQREFERIKRNDSSVLVFPVWWWSVPALMKGWIDRIWTNGFAYGGTTFPHKQVWMLGVAGNHLESYTKRGYDAAMKTSLDLGILNFCGIERTRLELLHGAIEGTEFPQQLLKRSWELAQQFSADAKAAKSA